MKRRSVRAIARSLVSVAALSCVGCVSIGPESEAREEKMAGLHETLAVMQLRRPVLFGGIHWEEGQRSTFALIADGRWTVYRAWIDDKGRVGSILPVWWWHEMPDAFRLMQDTVHDPVLRGRLISAARRANSIFQWRLVGKAAVQPFGGNYVVSWVSLTDPEIDELIQEGYLLDPFSNFLVSPSGVVLGAFEGA